ncbi:MAG TPA: hypothetical protein VFB74_28860 [Kribbellaceae bacterium]|nr:hypothetical protein [Kribbellaceae bacterium]
MDALICRCPRGHADERVLLSVQELLNRIATLGFRREPPGGSNRGPSHYE